MASLERFNELLCMSIDDAISQILGPQVLESLYEHLNRKYSVSRDEVPYRLQTMYAVLHSEFGFKGARTIERQIAKNFCNRLNMPFLESPDCTLDMYIEKAKKRSATS
jgi:ABC-type dipeptide/oligopeptide/nickel transport system permease component